MKINKFELTKEYDLKIFDLIKEDILLMYYDNAFDDDKIVDDFEHDNIKRMKEEIQLNSILYYDKEEEVINLKNVIKFIMLYDYTSINEFELSDINEDEIENPKLKSLIKFMKFDIKNYLIDYLLNNELTHDKYIDVIESNDFELIRLFTNKLNFFNECDNMFHHTYNIIEFFNECDITINEEDNHIRNVIRQYNKVNDIKIIIE